MSWCKTDLSLVTRNEKKLIEKLKQERAPGNSSLIYTRFYAIFQDDTLFPFCANSSPNIHLKVCVNNKGGGGAVYLLIWFVKTLE